MPCIAEYDGGGHPGSVGLQGTGQQCLQIDLLTTSLSGFSASWTIKNENNLKNQCTDSMIGWLAD